MSEVFDPQEAVYLPKDYPEHGLREGQPGRIIHVYPNRPYMADVEFPKADGTKAPIAIMRKNPEVEVVGFYPL